MSHDARVIAFSGEYDLANAQQLADLLSPNGPPYRVVADLRDVTFMDSVALSQLVRVHKDLTVRGGSLVLLLASSGAVRRVLEMTQLDHVIPCTDSYDDALSLSDSA